MSKQPRATFAVVLSMAAWLVPSCVCAVSQQTDGTLIINPQVQVRVSPTYLTQDVAMPVTVTVLGPGARPIIGATVRLTNAQNSTIVLGTGVTGASGRAIVGPVRPGPEERDVGVRVWVSSTSGSRNDGIIRVRGATGTFSVQEIRIIEPAQGARPSITQGTPVRAIAVIRGLGTGAITGWWTVNGMPLQPFTVTMRSGAPARVVAPERLADRLRIGPNSVTVRTITPNRLESRPALFDVFPPSVRKDAATTDGAMFPRPPSPTRSDATATASDLRAFRQRWLFEDENIPVLAQTPSDQTAQEQLWPATGWLTLRTGGPYAIGSALLMAAEDGDDSMPVEDDVPEDLTLQFDLSGALNASGRVASTSDDPRYDTVDSSSVDTGLAGTAAVRLAGHVTEGIAVDVGTSVIASSDSFSLGDLHAAVRGNSWMANGGRASIDYSNFTVSGLSSREAVRVGSRGIEGTAPGSWEAFGLRTDSGATGGLGAQDRYDRSAYGGRYSFRMGGIAANLTGARVWDSRVPGAIPGTYAPSQASSSIALGLSSALGSDPEKRSAVAELAWSAFDSDRTAAGGSDSGLAYNVQLNGTESDMTWAVWLYDIPSEFYTLGNPFLARGLEGRQVELGGTPAEGLSVYLGYADKEEDYLLGGAEQIAGVPATNVEDITLDVVYDAGGGWPALSLSSVWGDRSNGGVDDDAIDQSERTVTVALSKVWQRTSGSFTWSDYSLSDIPHGSAAVDTRQVTASVQHQLTDDYLLGATWSRYKSDLGTPSRVKSRLLEFTVDGPFFIRDTRFSAGYARSRNADSLGDFNTTDEEYRLRVGYQPQGPAASIWQRLLASLALEARLRYQDDPFLATDRVRRTEVWLVSSTDF